MRLSDAIILYLAAAAPFGTAFFLRRRAYASSVVRAFALSALAALGWPATAFLFLRSKARDAGEDATDAADADLDRKIEQLRRSIAAILVEVEELFASARGRTDEKLRFTLFVARESVTRFAGLARAAADVSLSAQPSARELELCRMAGRTGEDLLLAGRCVHRRNVIRLLLHRDRARNEMLHALAEVSEAAQNFRTQFSAGAQAARELSEAITRLYELVTDLFAAINDGRALEGVGRILDAERARSRRPEANVLSDDATRTGAVKGELCTTQAATTASAGVSK